MIPPISNPEGDNMNKVLKSLPFRLLLGLALGIILGRLFSEGAMKVVVSLQDKPDHPLCGM